MVEPLRSSSRTSPWFLNVFLNMFLNMFLCVSRFFFRSGNIEHPGDKLFNTSVEVLPFDVSPTFCHLLLDLHPHLHLHLQPGVRCQRGGGQRSKVKLCVCVCVQNIQAEKEALTDGREKTPQYQRTEDGFIRVGE